MFAFPLTGGPVLFKKKGLEKSQKEKTVSSLMHLPMVVYCHVCEEEYNTKINVRMTAPLSFPKVAEKVLNLERWEHQNKNCDMVVISCSKKM